MNDSRYQSRKFVLASAGFVAGVVFYATHYMDAGQWIGYSQWIVGLYLGANVADQAVTK